MSLLIGATSALQGASGQGGGGDLGETIEQSVRFSGSQRLVGPDTQPTGDYTFACWFKRADDPTGSGLDTLLCFTGNQSFQLVEPNRSAVPHGICVRVGGGLNAMADGTMPDYSAWYHICFTVSSNTVTTYINGIKQSTSPTQPSGSDNMCIGSNSSAVQDEALVGYLAEVNLLDGHVVGDTTDADGRDILDEFGRVNEDGVWVPKKVTDAFNAVQYGDRGFRLQFQDGANLGDDTAPIGASGHTAANDFTVTGFGISAISSSNPDNDIDIKDTPTSNYPTANPIFVKPTSGWTRPTLTKANLRSAGGSGATGQDLYVLSSVGIPVGDTNTYYAEFVVDDLGGTTSPNYPFVSIKFAPDQGVNENKFSLGCDGTASSLGVSQTSGPTFTSTGDIVGITWNASTGTVTAAVNGGAATTWNLTAATHTSFITCIDIDSGNSGESITSRNYGQFDFIHQPASTVSLETNNLPEPTIKNGRDYFDVVTYSGDSSNTTAITGLNFTPDFVWIKNRNATDAADRHHMLYDSVRGENKSLESNDSGQEEDNANGLQSFDDGGFKPGSLGRTNATGNNYVAWCWKCDESFTPTVTGVSSASGRRNTTAGFSILTYTGNNSSGTITHGLNSAPEFILFKRRSVTDNWVVYHVGIGATKSLTLDDDSGEASSTFLSNTTPTGPTGSPASTITLGGVSGANGTGTFVAYCWHSVEGYSKFGSYNGVGNTGTDGPYIHLGFRPAFVVYKRTDQTGSPWCIADSARSPFNPHDIDLFANTNAQESASSDQDLDLLSNGFKHRNNSVDRNSDSTSTYVYMAFAENPSGGKNVPPVTART